MDSHVACSTDTDSRMTSTKSTAFYKLHAAARLPHWLPYLSVSWTYDNNSYHTQEALLLHLLPQVTQEPY